MFGSVSPTVDADDAMALAEKLIDLYSPGSESVPLSGCFAFGNDLLPKKMAVNCADSLPGE